MPIYFHRLENALKRANEFIDVGKKPRALEILCDVLRSRKHRTWQKKHEDIMIKYLELCVELKKSYVAKEGIYQYKIICQQTYINSFEDVVRKYLEMAEEKANQAKEESQQSILDIDDLDNAQTPEDILLSAVSNEDTQDRTDRVVLIPWVKFLWESYRQCLDLLKNNSRTERLYHDIAHQAFQFCIKYNRKTEFRKLCDNLHTHLDILKKQQLQNQQIGHQQQNAINLNSPESLTMHLETRLVQLDSAIQMELWQEAYKATDDIKRFNLMNLNKKPPKPQMMANYYQKLSLVFWKANCPLFHSAALFRLFNLSKELRKNITPEDIQRMATKLVAATLAIPIPPNRAEIDKLVDTEENIVENHQRNLASLLGLTNAVPKRSSLIKDLKRLGVLQHALAPLQELYRILEVDFHPLVLCNRVQQVVDYIEKNANECPDLKQYIPALRDVTTMRLLKEVSQVYQTIEFTRLLELCPFATFTYLEKMVVEAARRNDLQVRIDHRKGCLTFGTEMRVSTGDEVIEGPHLQSMPSEQIRKQLVIMYSTLQKARNMIEPDRIKTQREEMKKKIMRAYENSAIHEHNNVLLRQEKIEKRKEMLEQIGLQREAEERQKQEEQQEKLRQAEASRIAQEYKEREQARKLRIDIEMKKQMAKDQISMMKGAVGGTLLENLDDEELAKLRPEDIQSKKIEQLEKERREQLAKQRKLERKIDHLERAKRIEEIPLLEAALEEWRVKDREVWDQMEEERIRDVKAERIQSVEKRDRFKRLLDDKEIFAQKIVSERHSVFLKELQNFQTILESERKRRLEERREKRKADRKREYLSVKEAEEKKRADEIKRKEREEKEAQFKAQVEKQMQKEREIEEKMRMKDEERQKEMEENRRKQQEGEDDRRGIRGDRREGEPRERSDKEEGNWRSDRGPAFADRRGPPIQSRGDRDRDEERARTRAPLPPSRADEMDDWRRDRPQGDRGGFDRDRDGGADRRRPPPPARADEDEDWKQVGGRSERNRDMDRRPPNRDRDFRAPDEERSWRRDAPDRDRNPPRSDRPFDRNRNQDRDFDRNRNPDRDFDRNPPQSRADDDNEWHQVGARKTQDRDRQDRFGRPEEDRGSWRSGGGGERNFDRGGPRGGGGGGGFERNTFDRNANRRDDRRDDRRDGPMRSDGPMRRDGPPPNSRADGENDWRRGPPGDRRTADRNSNLGK